MRRLTVILLASLAFAGCTPISKYRLVDEQQVLSSTGEQVVRTYEDRETGKRFTSTNNGPLVPSP